MSEALKIAANRIVIMENDKGWKPSRLTVWNLLRTMRNRGLKFDWIFCCASQYRGLNFNNGDASNVTISALKVKGKWEFFTWSGQKL